MSDDIKLINKDGVIKGIDPATGERIPVNFEDIASKGVSIERSEFSRHFLTKSGSRPLISTAETDLYVDPNAGDDSNDGSESSPIRTLKEAWGRVPVFVANRFHIHLADGTYSGGRPVMGPKAIVGSYPHQQPFVIKGNSNDRTAVVIDTNVNISVTGPEIDDAAIRDLTMRGSLRNANGKIRVRNVLFTGEYENATTNEYGSHGFTNHEKSHTQFVKCTFRSPLDVAAYASAGGEVSMYLCNGVVDNYALVGDRDAVFVEVQDGGLTGKEGFYKINTGGFVRTQRGKVWPADVYLADDFADGRMTDRMETAQKLYRPEWEATVGSPVIENGYARLPEGDSTQQMLTTPVGGNLKMVNGDWSVSFEMESEPTLGTFEIWAMRQANSDMWRTTLDAEGSLAVEKFEGGGSTQVISGEAPTFSITHHLTFRRRKDIDGSGNPGVELLYDAESIGTAAESFIPDPALGWDVRLVNRLDAATQVYSFDMRKA